MPGLPFFDDAASGPVRAPTIEVTISSSGGDSGGFGGMADTASSLLGAPSAPSWADYLVSLSLHQGFAPNVDQVDLLIADNEGAPQASLGDRGTIAIGAADALEDIFSGSIIAIERRGDRMRRYRLGNGSHDLAQARINQSVINMSVQDAISNAASDFNYSPQADVGGSDEALPQIVFDDSSTVWDHCAYLAGLRGANLWFDATDALQLADQLEQGDSVATFTWGEDLLEANLWQRSAHSGAITAFGGDRVDGDFVLRKQATPNRAEQGDGLPPRFYRDGLLQTQQDLSTRAAAAALYGQRQTSVSEIVVSGSAALGPGRVVELASLPDGGDGNYLIHRSHHTFDHNNGWRTRLSISEASGASGLGGLGGGLL